VARELKQSSDYLPISIEFEWENVRETQEKRQRRAWKRLNKIKFAKLLTEGAEALKFFSFTTDKDINDYAKTFTKAIRTAIDAFIL
jgi:hypothetical protein